MDKSPPSSPRHASFKLMAAVALAAALGFMAAACGAARPTPSPTSARPRPPLPPAAGEGIRPAGCRPSSVPAGEILGLYRSHGLRTFPTRIVSGKQVSLVHVDAQHRRVAAFKPAQAPPEPAPRPAGGRRFYDPAASGLPEGRRLHALARHRRLPRPEHLRRQRDFPVAPRHERQDAGLRGGQSDLPEADTPGPSVLQLTGISLSLLGKDET